jgi:hypothetical protein
VVLIEGDRVMTYAAIDHLVLAARSLDEGSRFVFDTLGVRPQEGGEHATQGTHNRVLRLGDACYLEVIAINPDAPKPPRPRWFELDTEGMREKLEGRPRLITWAVRTDQIEELARRCPRPLGEITPMRRGDLQWRLTLTEDGHLPGAGLVPFLIQWSTPPHPAERMDDQGRSLESLEGFHPRPETVLPAIEALGMDRLFSVSRLPSGSTPSLAARIRTPAGLKTLC